MLDYSKLLNELNDASLFQLYRLSCAIDKVLDDPERIANLRRQLQIGMHVHYFDYTDNRLVPAKILEIKKKKVLVCNLENQRRILVPYFMLNLAQEDATIYGDNKTLTANHIKVGDRLEFQHNSGEIITGTVLRINPKTVTLITPSGAQWRVTYAHLHRIHDAEIEQSLISVVSPLDE